MKESGEGGESLKVISLAISILAVLVAMVTVLGHRSHTEAILMQSRAADQWNVYQAQKIRRNNLLITVDQMDLQPSLSDAATAKREEYKTHIQKWETELAQEEQAAEAYEQKVDHAEAKAFRYDLGEALLQISVVLCSITLFTRKRTYFLMGLALGAAGLITAGSAVLLHWS
jgi:CHASE2 domain-containing sensor protein